MVGVFFNLNSECDNIRILLFDDETSAIEWMFNWLVENNEATQDDDPALAIESFQDALGGMEYFHVYPVVSKIKEAVG